MRGNSSFQFSFTDFTTLPYVLHLSKKAKEFMFKKSDMLYSEEKLDELENEDLDILDLLNKNNITNYSVDINFNSIDILDEILNAEIDW